MTKQPPSCSMEELQAAEDVLDTVQERFNVRPDVLSYNIVIDAWAKSNVHDAANRAEELLDILERRYRGLAPDSYTYTSVINAIDRSRHVKARGSWAEDIMNRMKEMHTKGLVEQPTTAVYNALLNCLVRSGENGAIERLIWKALLDL